MPASTQSKRTTPPKRSGASSRDQITSAASWAKQETDGVVTELPTGKIVLLVRKLDLPVMLRSGRIPNPLSGIIQGMISSGKSELPTEQFNDPVIFEQMMNMVDASVSAAMVQPKAIRPPVKGEHPATSIAFSESDEAFQKRWDEYEAILDDVEANTISTDWIALEDKIFIFYFAQGGAADLATFRKSTGDAMAAISGS